MSRIKLRIPLGFATVYVEPMYYANPRIGVIVISRHNVSFFRKRDMLPVLRELARAFLERNDKE